MWVARRAFRFRGASYAKGDQVPAEGWVNRAALEKTGRIARVADPAPPPPPPVKLSDLKRDELNAYAVEHGIAEPEKYRTKDELVTALEDLESSGNQPPPDTGTPSVAGAGPAPTDSPTTDAKDEGNGEAEPITDPGVAQDPPANPVPNDDLFADDSEPVKPTE